MLNKVIMMGRLTSDPTVKRHRTVSPLPHLTWLLTATIPPRTGETGKPTSFTFPPGVKRQSLSRSIFQRDNLSRSLGGCKPAPGRPPMGSLGLW